jgi:hypothetical protein
MGRLAVMTITSQRTKGSAMLNNSDDSTTDTGDTESDLMSPKDRRLQLDQQIKEVSEAGYRVMSQVGYVVVMAKAGAPRIEIFVDEFGHIHR